MKRLISATHSIVKRDGRLNGVEIPLFLNVFTLFAFSLPPPIITGAIVGKVGRLTTYRDIEKRNWRQQKRSKWSSTLRLKRK